MEYELTFFTVSLLVVAGLVAGFMNTIAGGGSMLTLPALMIMGMPADVANGTNRVGILLQSFAGARRFQQKGKLDAQTIIPTLVPVVAGSLPGALVASFLPVHWLKPALLSTMLLMALIMVLRPSIVAPPYGTPALALKERPLAIFGLFVAGFYGGFVQAGVGFIIIATLAGVLNYDLVRANALKMAINAGLTIVALSVYLLRDQVLWIPGLILAIGTVAGTVLSVQFAINVPQSVLKWTMFAIILLVCVLAYFS